MSVAYIREKAFLQEVTAAGRIWVAKSVYQNIYAMEIEEGELSLPVWSTRERAIGYLKIAKPIGPAYEPHEVPLKTFVDAWLSDKSMAIAELQINPNGTESRVLCLTSQEFRESQGVQ